MYIYRVFIILDKKEGYDTMETRGDYQKRWRQILLIRPYYRADGRTASKIFYLDGSSDDLYCRCEQVVAELAQVFYTTVPLAQKRASKLLGESKERKVPILLHEDFCLVPLKFREEKQKNTGTIGYVVLRHVTEVEHHLSGVRLHFRNSKVHADIPQRRVTVTKQLKRAGLLLYNFQQEQSRLEQEQAAGKKSTKKQKKTDDRQQRLW